VTVPDGSNGNGAKMREIALHQITWTGGIVATIALAVWGIATWSRSVETSWQQPIAAMQQGLLETRALLDQQRQVVNSQQETLAKVVNFMERETMARRAVGSREKLRKELCARNDLRPELCQSLPSDEEIEALMR
jgi:hypothetical protein